ncbi:MAG: hypothetical protein IJX13_06735 [Clostridia bacterium]|nr:hypothetical protein [Clostridia bacterium]
MSEIVLSILHRLLFFYFAPSLCVYARKLGEKPQKAPIPSKKRQTPVKLSKKILKNGQKFIDKNFFVWYTYNWIFGGDYLHFITTETKNRLSPYAACISARHHEEKEKEGTQRK